MVEASTKIVNATGMHAQAAASFISFLHQFGNCNITIIKDTKIANAKSILNLLILGLNQGCPITVRVEGTGEQHVLEQVIHYIENMTD